MRILAIDAGNTRIKWGLHDGQQWLQRGCVQENSADLMASLLLEPDQIIISNVAGDTVAADLAKIAPPERIHTVQARNFQCGVSNHYEPAEQLGSDRWAALIAAHQSGATSALVVTAGTALTVDALHQGEFLGGLIAPGFQLMLGALAQNTAQLRTCPGKLESFPTNTADAIHSGCVLTLSGAIEQMRTILSQHTQQTVTIWLNGGDASLLAPLLPPSIRVEDNLVLTGLYYIAQEVYA